MVTWTSVISDRTTIAIRIAAITAAGVTTAIASVRDALALASAQIAAFLIARLLQRPAVLDVLLSIGALFVAPFAPGFVIVPTSALVVFLRRHTTLLTRSNSAREMMTTIRALSQEGSLDPVTLARSLLEELNAMAPIKGATVKVGSRTLASHGTLETPDRIFSLTVGGKSIGQIAIEGIELTAPARSLIHEALSKLETALLFTEARSLASAAERSRLARDMHDGIAQELTSVGYLIDDLLVDAPENLRGDLRSLRNELTRVISELRLSIFELRSTTTDSLSLGTALSDYVNQVRETSPFKIHLNMDEGTARLSESVEQELLRIVQEAMANARRHSRATNLWIACQIRAPRALITIDDDGVGIHPGRPDSFGMNIMRERATQIGAVVTVSDRKDSGTTVTIELGG